MLNGSIVVDHIVAKLLCGDMEKGGSYFSSLRRIATWSMPSIDYAFQDVETGKTVALLFRNEFSDNDSIKTFAVKAINNFDAVIVAYDVSVMAFADLFIQTLKKDRLLSLPIGVIVCDNAGNVSVMHKFSIPANTSLHRTRKEQKSYWCWWRDSSQYEVANLLELSYKYDDEDGDIYTKKVYPEFFEMMINGQTKMWDGTPRKKTFSTASYKAEKQNYKIPMCQLGLWDADTGHITDKGLTLLDVIKTYGEDSHEYFDCLAKLILIDGKHLDLVKNLEEFQKKHPELIPENSGDFFVLFDDYMMQKNSIGTRKPTAVKTGAKRSYVRDEPKLWNKLGIIKQKGTARYYRPFLGIEFDWDRINEILLSDVFGGNDEWLHNSRSI